MWPWLGAGKEKCFLCVLTSLPVCALPRANPHHPQPPTARGMANLSVGGRSLRGKTPPQGPGEAI